MTDTFTPKKHLTLQGIGGNNNTWGTILNNSLSLIDAALGGEVSAAISGDTTLNGTQAQNTHFVLTGTLTANAKITFPATFFGFAAVHNSTIGGFDLTCGITGGFFGTVPNGKSVLFWSDGTDFHYQSAAFAIFTKTFSGDPAGATDNTTGFNAQVAPGNSDTNNTLAVIPRGNWNFSGNIVSNDLTTLMMLPGTKLGFYSNTATGNTHTTTAVDGISIDVLVAGWQVGMSIRSSNADIPAGTTIVAIDPGGHAVTLSAAATGTNVGGSLGVFGGSMSATPSIQWYQFSRRQVGLGFARSLNLGGTATGGLDGRGLGTADQTGFLFQTTSQITNSATSYNKRSLFVQTDQLDFSPNAANNTNASPNREIYGFWSGITSRVTPGSNGYDYTVHGRITGMYSKATIVKNGSAFTQGASIEVQNLSTLPIQKFPYQNGGTAFALQSTSVLAAGGTGYVVNDVLTLVGGTSTSAAQVKVTGVSSGVVTTFTIQTPGVYSVLPTNPVAVTGGAGVGFTLTAVWQGQQASNHGISLTSTGNTAATSAIAVLADAAMFWDGIMLDAAAIQNNAFSLIDTPGPTQNVLASIDNTGFMRASGLICTNDGSVVSKIRSKSTAAGDAVFLSDTPGQKWQFGTKNSDGSFKIANTEGTLWTGTILSLTPNGDITMQGANSFTANGTQAFAFTNVAPTGASASIQKWFTVSDGTRKYYIPAF